MIETTNAIEVFNRNIGRTDALIEAMDKIKAYNRLYQMSESIHNSEHAEVIVGLQNEQLSWIEQSCAEHAIISLATAFETYYKELVQELLADYPNFFLSREASSIYQLRELIESAEKLYFEKIGKRLNIRNRFDIYHFMEYFQIPFLSVQESDFIEYVYAKRNNFVHSDGTLDRKTITKFEKIAPHVNEILIRTESKILRTKLTQIIRSLHRRVLQFVARKEQ